MTDPIHLMNLPNNSLLVAHFYVLRGLFVLKCFEGNNSCNFEVMILFEETFSHHKSSNQQRFCKHNEERRKCKIRNNSTRKFSFL